MEVLYARRFDEPFDDYFVRLFENKDEYNLSCQDIADILNSESGVTYGESKWRKEYAAFRRGMQYERQKELRKIKNRIFSISDTHVPYQLPISAFSDYGGITDTLVLNGDIADCQAISKFPKTYRVSPMKELIETRQYLIDLIKYISPAKVVINYGNHDIRFQQYLAKSLDSDLLELMPKTALELIVVDGFHHYDKAIGAKTYYSPIQEVIDLIKQYDFTGQRRVSFEYTMFAGFNDTKAHADALVRMLKGLECRMNLIRFHKIPDFPYETSPDVIIENFKTRLNNSGIMTTVRASRGEDILAACGMLAGEHNK